MNDSTSVSLLERVCQGSSQESWARFADLYTPLICYWGRRAGLPENDVLDLAQEVLLQLIRKLPEFRYDSNQSFRGWLRTVTRNKWLEKRRKASLPVCAEPSALDSVSVENDIDKFWESEYRQHLVSHAMKLMQHDFQPATWKACWYLIVDDRPASEVAEELNLTLGAVYAAKCRVLRRLRQELNGLVD